MKLAVAALLLLCSGVARAEEATLRIAACTGVSAAALQQRLRIELRGTTAAAQQRPHIEASCIPDGIYLCVSLGEPSSPRRQCRTLTLFSAPSALRAHIMALHATELIADRLDEPPPPPPPSAPPSTPAPATPRSSSPATAT